jgi:hypothetical protein
MNESPIPSLGLLKCIDDFDNFAEVRAVPPHTISEDLIKAVRQLDERDELEPYRRRLFRAAGKFIVSRGSKGILL